MTDQWIASSEEHLTHFAESAKVWAENNPDTTSFFGVIFGMSVLTWFGYLGFVLFKEAFSEAHAIMRARSKWVFFAYLMMQLGIVLGFTSFGLTALRDKPENWWIPFYMFFFGLVIALAATWFVYALELAVRKASRLMWPKHVEEGD